MTESFFSIGTKMIKLGFGIGSASFLSALFLPVLLPYLPPLFGILVPIAFGGVMVGLGCVAIGVVMYVTGCLVKCVSQCTTTSERTVSHENTLPVVNANRPVNQPTEQPCHSPPFNPHYREQHPPSVSSFSLLKPKKEVKEDSARPSAPPLSINPFFPGNH